MEYHKIETLYERDKATFKVRPGEFKNRTYTLLKEWSWTEKIDGTNIRANWSGGGGTLWFGGKTDKAQLPPGLPEVLSATILPEKMREVFPDAPVVLYGEGYGAGIQKGGIYSPTKKFILFDVLVDNKWWLNDEAVRNVGEKLGVDVVPSFGVMTLEQAAEMVRDGFNSIVARKNGVNTNAEGLVGRPSETLFDKKHARLITKLKTKDF